MTNSSLVEPGWVWVWKFEMEFSKGNKMSSIIILSLCISYVCLSEAIVHLVQEMVKISRGKIIVLLYFILFYFFIIYLDRLYCQPE